jgi:hypothetical protein
MAKKTEETLANWTRPASDTEETKLQNAVRMVKEALSEDEKIKSLETEVFGQGSYANDTNVRNNSDIDINVRFTGGFYYDLPEGKTSTEYGFDSEIEYSAMEFKNDVEKALIEKFGTGNIKRKNKCITVLGNSYRVETDVVPTWNYRRYDSGKEYHLGAKFQADDYSWIVNYPIQHIDNGKSKNAQTSKRFKRLTRIYRNLRYDMINNGEVVNTNITSFLLECLVWNVPNSYFNDYTNWTDRLKESIRYLYQQTESDELCDEWGEVSELLYLFKARKWSRQEVNNFLVQVWNYLEF